jgi:hypothetical protein
MGRSEGCSSERLHRLPCAQSMRQALWESDQPLASWLRFGAAESDRGHDRPNPADVRYAKGL